MMHNMTAKIHRGPYLQNIQAVFLTVVLASTPAVSKIVILLMAKKFFWVFIPATIHLPSIEDDFITIEDNSEYLPSPNVLDI